MIPDFFPENTFNLRAVFQPVCSGCLRNFASYYVKRPLVCVVIFINVVYLELYLQGSQACQSTCD